MKQKLTDKQEQQTECNNNRLQPELHIKYVILVYKSQIKISC